MKKRTERQYLLPMRKFMFDRGLTALILLLLAGCTGIPEGIEPIAEVDSTRYIGTWYEIARLDHSFERGLIRVKAQYQARDDGGLDVVNMGFDPQKKQWKKAEGKAYFIGPRDVGRLKVSFFGPFYSSYNIIALDRQNYQWALVCGPNRSYLWLLARTPSINPSTTKWLVEKATALGFDTKKLIYVDQSGD